MRTTKLLKQGFVLTIGAFICSGAIADNCNGRWTNVGQSAETIDLGNGHKLTIFSARGS